MIENFETKLFSKKLNRFKFSNVDSNFTLLHESGSFGLNLLTRINVIRFRFGLIQVMRKHQNFLITLLFDEDNLQLVFNEFGFERIHTVQ